MTLIYCASAIDLNGAPEVEWPSQVMRVLSLPRMVLYCPQSAFRLSTSHNREAAQAVMHVNHEVLSASDLLLVYWQPTVPSWGVPIELHQAYLLGMPIIVWCSAKSLPTLPVYLQGCVPEEHMVNTLLAVTQLVRKVLYLVEENNA